MAVKVQYMADCRELFGIILDPCDVVISSVDEGTCKKKTEDLWNFTYPEEPYELDVNDCFHNDLDNRLLGSLSTGYDLVSAVKRQSSFYYQVSRAFFKKDMFLEGAIQRYKGFLHMIKRNMEMKSSNFCVPTYDIDLIWHTHQLHPLSYFNDMMRLLGKVLDHDDTDSDRTKGQKLDVGFSRTTNRWKEMFSSRYWRAGAMYVPPVEAQNRCNIPKLSSEIMFMEIMVELIEIRSFPSKHEDNLVLSIGKKPHDLLLKNKHHLTICTETEETQAVFFLCEPKGVLLFDLLHGSSKSLGTCLISISELDSKLASPTWLTFESDKSMPISLGIVISTTPPSPIQHMGIRSQQNGSDQFIGDVPMTGGACSGSGGCGGGCGGGGGCRASCGGCRSSCGGGGNCSAK